MSDAPPDRVSVDSWETCLQGSELCADALPLTTQDWSLICSPTVPQPHHKVEHFVLVHLGLQVKNEQRPITARHSNNNNNNNIAFVLRLSHPGGSGHVLPSQVKSIPPSPIPPHTFCDCAELSLSFTVKAFLQNAIIIVYHYFWGAHYSFTVTTFYGKSCEVF